MKRIEILAIGREILSGRVLDTNTHWLARRLTSLGGKVQRRVIVDGEPEEIAREVSLKSNPSHFVPNLQLQVRVTASGDEEEEVKKRIQRDIEELKARLRRPLEEGAGR